MNLKKRRHALRAVVTALAVIVVATVLALAALVPAAPAFAATARPKAIATKIKGGDRFPVYYRPTLPVTAPRVRYPGFKSERAVLRAGTVRTPGAMPLICDIMFERDVPVRLRDGTIIYTDVFRPADGERCPALICISPFGKEIGGHHLDDLPDRAGVIRNATSGLERFGGLDPAYWVAQGYAIVNPDPRGAYSSHGNINYWGTQYAEDGCDIVEWAALQPWCNGRIGMAGTGWLATSQWFIAAEDPPHLEAIAPWEGMTDVYRQSACRGGIPAPEMHEQTAATLSSKSGLLEDLPQMIVRYPFINAYWNDKIADLDAITVPAYIATGYTSPYHTQGTLDAFASIASREKWLRVYNTQSIYDLYDPRSVADLNKFFDYYLKDVNNGWRYTPRVRLAVHDPGHRDIILRAEDEFPLARRRETCLYLDAAGHLSWNKPDRAATFTYDTRDERAASVSIYTFKQDTEITGAIKLHLWIAAENADDLDISVRVEKLGTDGLPLNMNAFGSLAATGMIRASCRELDESGSTESQPRLTGRGEQKLTPGLPVALDIAVTPMGMIFHAGESLRLTVYPHHTDETLIPFGSALVTVPRDNFTYMPDENVPMVTLGGAKDAPAPTFASPAPRNTGRHTIYAGGYYDSYLLVPIIPQK